MSLLLDYDNHFGWFYSLTTAPTLTPGVTVTPANGSKGTYAQLASGANLVNDVYGILLNINTGFTTATARPIRLDLGTDPAGGTSYTARIKDILCGASANSTLGMGYWYYFPYKIKAGSSIGVAAWGIETGTLRVWGQFYGRPSRPDWVRSGQWSETVGTPSGAGGVGVTPGTSGAAGAWASLGTSVRNCWWWQLSAQVNNSVVTALNYFFDLAWGDGSNKHTIQQNLLFNSPGTTEAMNFQNGREGGADVPAGATLYARASCSGAPVTGFTCLAHGIGG